MIKLSLARILAIIIFIYSLLVMVGWVFNVDALTRVAPYQQPMVFVTAFGFFINSIALWFIEDIVKKNTEAAFLVIPGVALTTLLLTTTIVAAGLFGAYTGITDLFVAGNAPITTAPGFPAVMTVLGFVFFDASALHSFFIAEGTLNRFIRIQDMLIVLIGIIAITGYVLKVPLLYYQFRPDTTPMAANTAFMFILLGTGLILAKRNIKK